MTKENTAAAPEAEAKEQAPAPQKVLRAKFTAHQDINQNDFKNFVKACPFSTEGGQALTWENGPDATTVTIKVQVPADLEQEQFDEWLLTSGEDLLDITTLDDKGTETVIREQAEEEEESEDDDDAESAKKAEAKKAKAAKKK